MNSNTKEDIWAKRAKKYDNLSWTKRKKFLDKTLEAGEFKKDDMVLDVGSGTGRITNLIAPFVNRVIGIDISPDMLDIAGKYRLANVEFKKANVLKIPFEDETFDKITARMIFHHVLEDTHVGVEECFRVLKKGGFMIFEEGVPPDHSVKEAYTEIFKLKEKRLTFMEEDIIRLMKKGGFEDIELRIHIMKQVSLKNWLENSGLPRETQDKILKMHTEADDNFKDVYNMTITDDDTFIDMKFVIAVGRK